MLGVNQGPPLDWQKVKMHERLTDEEWYGLAPEAILAQLIATAVSGPVPPDKEEPDHPC